MVGTQVCLEAAMPRFNSIVRPGQMIIHPVMDRPHLRILGGAPGGILSRGDIVQGGYCQWEILIGGYCPGDIVLVGHCPGGILSRGILSRGDIDWGILSWGYCPGGILSRGILVGGYCPGGYWRGDIDLEP